MINTESSYPFTYQPTIANSPSLMTPSASVFLSSGISGPAASYKVNSATARPYQQWLQIRQTSLKTLFWIRNHLLRFCNHFSLKLILFWLKTCFPTVHWSSPSEINRSVRFFSVSMSTLRDFISFVRRFMAPIRIWRVLSVDMVGSVFWESQVSWTR